jgi:hypothetical protein
MVKKSFIKSFFLIILLISCTPQKRLNKLIKKHPTLVQLDTIVIRDTIVIEDYSHDTTTIFQFHDSTTVVNNEKVILKYFYDTLTREIHHEYICLGDTVIQEKIVQVEKVVYKELSWWEQYQTLVYILLGLFVALIIYKNFTK